MNRIVKEHYPAANLPDATSDATKHERLARLQNVINDNARRVNTAMVGSIQNVLVEKPSKKNPNEMSGRTENMRYVNFPGDARMIGQFIDVEITQAMTNSLRGRVHVPLAQSA